MASELARRTPSGPARRSSGSQRATATYTITDAQSPARPQARTRPVRQQYSPPPTTAPSSGSNSISILEAEYLGAVFLIFLTVFTDQTSSYSSKMLAVMKRLTFASILFFILGLMATGSENTAKFSKAVGALVVAGIFLGTAGQGSISALDSFFKGDWTQGDTTEGDSSANAPAGTQTTTGTSAKAKGESLAQTVQNAVKTALEGFGLGRL